jgi:short-subunit dehydrogenase
MKKKTMTQKKAIIIGATSGIGLEMVEVLTSQGWQVGIAGRRQALLQQIQSKNLDVIATECIDITQEDAPRRLLSLIGKTGGMDLYFHSAGIGYQNPALDLEKEMATVATNVVGFTQMVDTAFHYFEQHPQKEGHLTVISSIAGTRGLGAAPAYSSTKRYANHYMECLSQLCHIRGIHHIHLHDIRPGFVRTPLIADGYNYPLQLDPHDVALSIARGIRNNRSIITIDWRYRLLVAFWRMIPRWLWVRLKVASK